MAKKKSVRKSSGGFGSSIGAAIQDDFSSIGAGYHGRKKMKKEKKNIFYRMR